MHKDVERILISEAEIQARVCELGAAITRDYRGMDVVLVGILKGAVIFFSDLIRKIDLDVAIDFMAISSYGNATESAGVVRFLKDLDHSVADKHVIIVEDIIDTGLTLSFLRESLLSRGAKTIEVCALLDKYERRRVDIHVKYKGFEIPDAFVVGYGLDYAEKYRNLSEIGILNAAVYKDA